MSFNTLDHPDASLEAGIFDTLRGLRDVAWTQESEPDPTFLETEEAIFFKAIATALVDRSDRPADDFSVRRNLRHVRDFRYFHTVYCFDLEPLVDITYQTYAGLGLPDQTEVPILAEALTVGFEHPSAPVGRLAVLNRPPHVAAMDIILNKGTSPTALHHLQQLIDTQLEMRTPAELVEPITDDTDHPRLRLIPFAPVE